MTPEIEQYLRELLQAAGQVGLAPEMEKTLMQDLFTRLEERLLLTALEYLSDDQQDMLQEMAENKKSSQEIQAFIQTSIPNYKDVFSKTLIDFRDTYVKGARG